MLRSPYPGLRPFRRDEADVFFGRETHVDAMIDRLARQRLLAVVGSSGCGKSSLVRAGLLEALETGLLAEAGTVWHFAILRPGGHPMTELAIALAKALGGGHSSDDVSLRRAGLERGPLSLVDELRDRPLPDGGNLLILIDQFEELFRFQDFAAREEAEAFVALLLASANQRSVPIYIVLTMRSDFLGHCARFYGLAEAVSDSDYLCPRLTREQIVSAIEGPANVFSGKVEPRLTARIINDMGTDPDQLPLMQHVLMRLWGRARERHSNSPTLRFDDYIDEGALGGSLSRHADQILEEITRDSSERLATTRRLFCLLTDGEGDSAMRRITPVSEVMAVTGKPLTEVALVVDAFRAPGRSLLMAGRDGSLTPDTILDISHESLIRQWETLRGWVREEAASAEQYREMVGRARRWEAGEAPPWDSVELDAALAWRKRERPTVDWAKRYGGYFDLAMRFLRESRARREQERRVVEERRDEVARTQSRFLTQQAHEALRADRPELAGLTARAALPADPSAPDRPIWTPALLALLEARCCDWQRAVLVGHKSFVNSGAFSPDETRVVTAGADHTARLWDAKTGAQLAVLKGHTAPVNSAAFSPDGSRIITASADYTACLWDAKSGVRIAMLQHASFVLSAAFSHDGARLVTASADRTARLWDAANLSEIAVFQGHTGELTSAAFGADGTKVVTSSVDHSARQWDASTGSEVAMLQGHDGAVFSATFSPDGARIATASADRTARLWDATTGAPIIMLRGHAREVNSAAFSPDGWRLVTASADQTARLWDATAGTQLAVFHGHSSFVNRAAFAGDGTRVVTASADRTARLWDFTNEAQIAVLQGHTNEVNCGIISPDGGRVVTASWDTTARLWDGATGDLLAELKGHESGVTSASFSPDGKRVITGSAGHTARLWDAETAEALAVLDGHTRSINSVAFRTDGERIVTASADRTARLWDTTGILVAVLEGHENFVNSAAFSPNGVSIVTASADSTVRLWDADGGPVAVLDGHTSFVNGAAFSPNGASIVTASADHTARLWDAKTGALFGVLTGHTAPVTYAAFSPDGARVVTASADCTARLWETGTGALLASLEGHTSFVRSAAFSADGLRVVTASADHTAVLWDVENGAPLALLKGHCGPVYSAAFSPDGTRVVTASADRTARVWAVWPLLAVDTIAYCDVAALRVLSKEERTALYLSEASAPLGQRQTAVAADHGEAGDQLTAEVDPNRHLAGVPLGDIETEKAVEKGRAAVEAAPDEPRFRYELGRALARADKPDEAAACYRAAAEKRYAAAQNDLGSAYEKGIGVPKDANQALLLYRQAAEGGYLQAFYNVGRCYWDGIAVETDRVQALRWFERGADEGDAWSHRRLAELYETGDQLPQDLEQALCHHAIQTRLFEASGDDREAAAACARRGSLARALSPEIAVRAARRAAEWGAKRS